MTLDIIFFANRFVNTNQQSSLSSVIIINKISMVVSFRLVISESGSRLPAEVSLDVSAPE